jgi:hypothetical protein
VQLAVGHLLLEEAVRLLVLEEEDGIRVADRGLEQGPTVLVKYVSLLWLWYRAPCTPPPYGMRITIGTPKVPFDR